MVNRLIIAAAGSGKTTYLVRQAMQQSDSVLITTYTIANELEIRKKFVELNGCVPHNVTILLQRILFDAIICRIRKIKTSHF